MSTPRVVMIGLDGLVPELVFDRFAAELPHLGRLMRAGAWGRLESVTPAVTVPAWASAMTGRDPGELGIYGFSRRVPGSYGLELVDSTDVRRETLWERASRAGVPVIVVGVPPGYPPRRVEGCYVSCFLAPDTRRKYTYPAQLAEEITRVVGDYRFDVEGFRTRDKREVARDVCAVTRQRFQLFRHLLARREWGLALMVDMGPDRMHHALLRHLDARHPHHVRMSPYRDVIRDYYRLLDELVGALMDELPPGTAILVLSDHGARPMCGGICVNEWLLRHGYLTLRAPVARPTALTPELVDWSRTRAWALGGYAGRLQLNLRGREPMGTVPFAEARALLDELAAGLAELTDGAGAPIAVRVLRPRSTYAACEGLPPELLLEFGDLDLRALGVVGTGTLELDENDGAPDDANHDRNGVFILHGPGVKPGERFDLRLIDCHRTLAELLGLRDGARDSA